MQIKNFKKNIIIFFALFFILGLLFLPGYRKLNEMRTKNEKLLHEIKKLKKKNLQLSRERRKLKKDRSYIEKIARQELGLARDGEIIFKIENEAEDWE